MKGELNVFSTGFYLLLSFLILLGMEGYVFGTDDQSEMLAYAAYLRDKTLFSQDFYIQSIVHEVPNERWFFSWLLSCWGEHLEIPVFLAFCATTMLLLLALYRIARTMSGNDSVYIPWLIALAVIIPLNGISLGENEIYYNVFLPGTLALSIGAWSWYYWLKDKILTASLILIPATLIHPMSGFHIFVLQTAAFGIRIIMEKKAPKIKAFIPTLIYGLFCFPWLSMIILKFENSNVSGGDFMEMIRFRLAHHFIPTAFPLKNYMIIGSLIMIGLAIIFKKSNDGIENQWSKLRPVFFIAIIGSILYTIGVEIFNLPIFITTQWFSLSLWLKSFTILVIAVLVKKQFETPLIQRWDFFSKLIIPFAGILVALMSSLGLFFFKNRDYQFPWNELSLDKQIASQCQKCSGINDIFLIPPDFTSFPYYSHRSNYISYKQMVHKKKVMTLWYQRIRQVYAVDQNGKLSKDITSLRNNWLQKDTTFFNQMHQEFGINFILTYAGHKLPYKVVAENKKYKVYKL